MQIYIYCTYVYIHVLHIYIYTYKCVNIYVCVLPAMRSAWAVRANICLDDSFPRADGTPDNTNFGICDGTPAISSTSVSNCGCSIASPLSGDSLWLKRSCTFLRGSVAARPMPARIRLDGDGRLVEDNCAEEGLVLLHRSRKAAPCTPRSSFPFDFPTPSAMLTLISSTPSAFPIPHRGFWCGIPLQGFRLLVWDAPNLGKSTESRRGTGRRAAAIAHSLNSGTGGWRSEPIKGLTRPVCKHRDRNLGNHT